jgi:hypothetical protein
MTGTTRASQRFPTRQYAYGRGVTEGLVRASALEAQPPAGSVFRFIAGRDAAPLPIAAETGRQALSDPFAQLVLFGAAPVPTSLRQLLAQLDLFNADADRGLPVQRSFLVADGGQIPWTPQTDDLRRDFRFVIVRQRDTLPGLLISASTSIDSDEAFLQVIGWDPAAGAYQFYDRRAGAWAWAGSSWDALAPDSRGRGPFDSHVNGALNMKELKLPWVNWHSESATILDSALAPDDPLRNEPLWIRRQPAQDFERTVARPGIQRWTDARFRRSLRAGDGSALDLAPFMRQVLETTTVNLASSPISNPGLATALNVPLPLTFFVAADALFNALDLEPDIKVPQVTTAIYREMLRRYEVRVGDGNHTFPGDTHFVFVVPEPAFEDLTVLQGLLSADVLSPKLAAALLMVDFVNPVFSARRAALLRYVPQSTPAASDFSRLFVTAIQGSAAAAVAGTPEEEFMANWNLPESTWKRDLEQRIETFFAAIQGRLGTPDGFAPLFELAESRRREFRRRPLAEFRLTTPITNVPETAPLLELSPAGDVQRKP